MDFKETAVCNVRHLEKKKKIQMGKVIEVSQKECCGRNSVVTLWFSQTKKKRRF